MKIATWNVRSMFGAAKAINIEREMCRLSIDVLGISESRHRGIGIVDQGETVLYYSGNDTNTHYNGVAVMIKKDLKKNVTNFVPVSDRLLILQLKAKPRNIQLIQVYAPTGDASEDDIEEFYDDLKKALSQLNKRDIILILGDFNAKVGAGRVNSTVGSFGLGERNDRGDRLIQFSEEEDMVISNTFFKLPPRRLYTWRSPRDSPAKVIRNQIDYILINKRYRNALKSVKTYPGADVKSDHNPVIACMECCMKIPKVPQPKARIDVNRLRDESIRGKAHTTINFNFEQLRQEIRPDSDIETTWKSIKTVTVNTGLSILQPEKVKRKNSWITDEILSLMDQRRQHKAVDDKQYRVVDHLIQKKVLEAKEMWMSDQCAEIEDLEAKYDWRNMHKKIKTLIGERTTCDTHTGHSPERDFSMSEHSKNTK